MSSKIAVWIYAAVLVVAGTGGHDALAATGKAPSSGDLGQITVRFGELNLDQPAGAAVLYRRIQVAAERVCGDPLPPGSFIPSHVWRRCVAQAIERAVIAVDRPALTAYYRVHTAPSDQKLLAELRASPNR
jgi:UrcA family protein